MDDKTILSIIDKFSSGTMNELDFSDGSVHLVLKKGGTGAAPAPAAESEASVRLGLPVNSVPAAGEDGETITSPIVATFYSSPSPEDPPFVKPGAKVKAGETLCILEAMKMMNHLEADFDCEVLAVKAQNGDLVEYGQGLFQVKRI
ncbi:acetyl-CoA carboxylase biotin carboxyl carrier protein [Breznakiella homolactica]|uniref:Biotin carboxyl carrier protein of acetyl-CoA carboxylase n=1 Tax=Breznakiella homolactica TaxID=2798577 RepID=A0A7T8BBW8_9SPIR|nr:acetyl-CoA carboxylase biotin carboxyl carrier protein [Breznakiella homolactica]QQO11012.1 acetyl-CoA carboxylase biotin carboxyl carrier protein [Breznakiella homolactica]